MGWSSAAAMAAAEAFQDAGRGVGAWLGVEWRGEELEHEAAKRMGRRELGRRGVKAGRHWWPLACREAVVAEYHRIEQGHSEGG